MNLLPKTEKDDLKKGFQARFFILAHILLALSFLIGLVFLLPSYLLVRTHLALITSSSSYLKNQDGELAKEILQVPPEIGVKLQFMETNANNRKAVDSLFKIIASMPEKVRLNSISLNKQGEKLKKGTLIIIAGIAESRDSLISFETALKENEDLSAVEVPVSSLAKEKNLPFSIKILIEDEKLDS